MEISPEQKRIIAAVDAAAECILSVSHQIHDRPETAYQEVFASGLLAETLETFGFQVERGVAGLPTAFLARKGKPDGPRVAFLAEYDALPEIGHACGHNVIASAALAAGIGLGALADELNGEVLVIGTPAEETSGGKVALVERGVFDQVDAALMVHPYHGNYTVAESLAMDAIQVEFFGKPAHAAAAPWEGKNALDALLLFFTNLNALRQQIKPDARIHGIITHGGVAPNIIPEYACGRFYVRARHRAYLDELVDKFEQCVLGAAVATGTRSQVSNYESSFDDIVNNAALAQRMADYMVDVLGSAPFGGSPDSIGSTDMGNVSQRVPAIHLMVDIADGQPFSPHTHEFCTAALSPFADQALLRAGKGLALTGYDFLQDTILRELAREEFRAALGHPPAREG